TLSTECEEHFELTAGGQCEECAVEFLAVVAGRSVQDAGVDEQRSEWIGAVIAVEVVNDAFFSVGRNLERSAVAASRRSGVFRRSVQGAVENGEACARVAAVTFSTGKAMQHALAAVGREFEDGSASVRAAVMRRAVELLAQDDERAVAGLGAVATFKIINDVVVARRMDHLCLRVHPAGRDARLPGACDEAKDSESNDWRTHWCEESPRCCCGYGGNLPV